MVALFFAYMQKISYLCARKIEHMNKFANILKPLMPIVSAVYGLAVIYVTALPLSGDTRSVVSEVLTWLITIAGIALTLWLVHYVEPKLYPESDQFALKLPKISIIAGLLLLAPLWLVAEEYIVYGLTSLTHTVQMESFTYTTEELRESPAYPRRPELRGYPGDRRRSQRYPVELPPDSHIRSGSPA